MLGFLWKVFGVLFPFLQEIFFGKKIQRGKKKAPDPFYHRPWFKNVLIAIGLISFLGVFYLAFMLYGLHKATNTKPSHPDWEPAPVQIVQRASEPASSVPPSVALPKPPEVTESRQPPSRPYVPRRHVPDMGPRQPSNSDIEEHQALLRQLRAIQDEAP